MRLEMGVEGEETVDLIVDTVRRISSCHNFLHLRHGLLEVFNNLVLLHQSEVLAEFLGLVLESLSL